VKTWRSTYCEHKKLMNIKTLVSCRIPVHRVQVQDNDCGFFWVWNFYYTVIKVDRANVYFLNKTATATRDVILLLQPFTLRYKYFKNTFTYITISCLGESQTNALIFYLSFTFYKFVFLPLNTGSVCFFYIFKSGS